MHLPRSGSCDNTLDVADPRPPQRSRSYDPDFRAPNSKVGNSTMDSSLTLASLIQGLLATSKLSLSWRFERLSLYYPSHSFFSRRFASNRMPVTFWGLEVFLAIPLSRTCEKNVPNLRRMVIFTELSSVT